MVLHCHISNLLPQISHTQPSGDTLTLTVALRSRKVSASVTNTGSEEPKFSTIWFAVRQITCID